MRRRERYPEPKTMVTEYWDPSPPPRAETGQLTNGWKKQREHQGVGREGRGSWRSAIVGGACKLQDREYLRAEQVADWSKFEGIESLRVLEVVL